MEYVVYVLQNCTNLHETRFYILLELKLPVCLLTPIEMGLHSENLYFTAVLNGRMVPRAEWNAAPGGFKSQLIDCVL